MSSSSREIESVLASSTPSSQRISLRNLHLDQSQRIISEWNYSHSIGHDLKSIVVQLFVHGPIGSIFAFSIFKSSSLRALEFSCLVLGDLAVATLFMSVSGKTRSAANASTSCQVGPDWRELAGKFIALGFAATVIAVLPVVAIFTLHTRTFQKVPFENCKAMRMRLRVWRILDAVMWTLGLVYAGFCAFYVMLFFANVAAIDHNAWLITACTTFVLDLMLTPCASVLVIFVTMWLCVLLLAIWTRTPRRQLIEQLRSTGEQSATLHGGSRSPRVSGASRASSASPSASAAEKKVTDDAEPNLPKTMDEMPQRSSGSYHLARTPSGTAVVLSLPKEDDDGVVHNFDVLMLGESHDNSADQADAGEPKDNPHHHDEGYVVDPDMLAAAG